MEIQTFCPTEARKHFKGYVYITVIQYPRRSHFSREGTVWLMGRGSSLSWWAQAQQRVLVSIWAVRKQPDECWYSAQAVVLSEFRKVLFLSIPFLWNTLEDIVRAASLVSRHCLLQSS